MEEGRGRRVWSVRAGCMLALLCGCALAGEGDLSGRRGGPFEDAPGGAERARHGDAQVQGGKDASGAAEGGVRREEAYVIRVIDGDTVELKGGEHVRLGSINAPESHERFGDRATRALAELVEHRRIVLRYGPRARDHYGRLVANLYLGDVNVQERMVRQGMAYVFIVGTSRPPDYDKLIAAQEEAREARRGLWVDARYARPVTVTSFHANAPGNDRKNLDREYLRLVNISSRPLDLEGWSMTNARGDRLVFPHIVVPPGFTFRVVSGKGSPDDTDGSIAVYWNAEREVWRNHGDRAVLYDNHGNEVLVRRYAPKTTRGW